MKTPSSNIGSLDAAMHLRKNIRPKRKPSPLLTEMALALKEELRERDRRIEALQFQIDQLRNATEPELQSLRFHLDLLTARAQRPWWRRLVNP